MARYEDYIKKEDGIESEIADAAAQQQARQDDATPVDWEERYRELEKLNSRQAQTLGDYRRTIDEFITNPTSTSNAESEESTPELPSADDYYDNPNAAVLKTVESHPAIREMRQMQEQIEQDRRQVELDKFAQRHPDYQDVGASAEFQNWVADNPTRIDLFQRGNAYDFSAADALFSLYKAEHGLAQATEAQQIQQAELVSSSGELVPDEPPKYSRYEYVQKLKRAKQGDLEAEDWVKANAPAYREALASGNVRD